MKKKGRKAQNALEFVMTYGWAILIMLVSISLLSYIFLSNPRNFNFVQERLSGNAILGKASNSLEEDVFFSQSGGDSADFDNQWLSYSKDGDNSRIANDSLIPPLKLKWKTSLTYIDWPSFSRLYYADDKVFVARLAPDDSGFGYNSIPNNALRAYNSLTGEELWESNCPKWSDGTDKVYGSGGEWVFKDGFAWGSTGRENCRINLSNGDTWIMDPYGTGVHNSYVNFDDYGIYSMGYDQISGGNIVVQAVDVFQKPIMIHNASGKFGQAMYFPGVFTAQDYLNLGDKLAPGDKNWTVMLWFNWNGVYGEGPKTFFARGSRQVNMSEFDNLVPSVLAYKGANFNSSYIAGISPQDPYYGVGGNVVFYSLEPQTHAIDGFDPGFPFYGWAGADHFERSISYVNASGSRLGNFSQTPHNWYHLTLTYDHEYQRMYKNGELVYQRNYTKDIGNAPGEFYIGGFRELGSYGGMIDEFAVFNRTLNDSEIQEKYDAEIIPDSSTQALLHFNNESAFGENDSFIYDYSGNGNNAYYDGHLNPKLRWRSTKEAPNGHPGGGYGLYGNVHGITTFPGGRGYGFGDIAVHNGILYVPIGKLRAYNATNGSIIWQKGKFPMSNNFSDITVGEVVYYTGVVYSNGFVSVAGRECLGPLAQEYNLYFPAGTFVGYSMYYNVSYCSNFSAPSLYFFNAITGEQVSKINLPEYACSTGFAPYGVAPFLGRCMNYYDRRNETDINHYGTRPMTDELQAKMIWESSIQPFQTIVENNVAYVSATEEILAYNIQTGQKLWEYTRANIPSNIFDLNVSDSGDIVLSGDLIYAIEHFTDEIITLNKTNGNVVWRFSSSDKSERFTGLIISNNTLFASSYNKDVLYAFEQGYENPSITNPLIDSIMPLSYKDTDYNYEFKAENGAYPYSWSISSGRLPSGLSITGDNIGYLSGSPTETGDFNFTARVTDSLSNYDERNFFLRVLPDTHPSISFTYPTPSNGTTQLENSIYVNLTSSDSDGHYSFVDFDRTNVLWMRMNEIDKDLSFGADYLPYIKDYSSYSISGTIKGNATWTPFGYSGGALDFNGDNSYLQITNGQLNNSLSVSLWARTTQYDASQEALFGSSPGGCYYGIRIYILKGIVWGYMDVFNASGYDFKLTVSSGVNITDGNWHNIVLVLDKPASNMLIYIDGNLRNSTNTTSTFWIKKLSTLNIGCQLSGSCVPMYYFNGSIDEVLLFNRSLSQQETLALYNSSANQYSNDFIDLGNGIHTFSAYAVDVYGNINQIERSITTGSAPDVTNPSGSSGGGGGGGGGASSVTYTLSESELTAGVSKQLNKNDKISFNLSGSWLLTLKVIIGNTATISLTEEYVMASGDTRKIDLNNDNFYDLRIVLSSISGNKIMIYLQKIHEAVSLGQEKTQLSEEEKAKAAQAQTLGKNIIETLRLNIRLVMIILAITIVIVLMVIFIIYLRRRKGGGVLFLQARNRVAEARERGYSGEKIAEMFRKKKWSEEDIDKIMK